MMPYKEGKKWRAVVTYEGKRYQALLARKRAAVDWESKKRKELKKTEKRRQKGMDLMTYWGKYLDHCSSSFTSKTYQEKRSLCRRVLSVWGSDILVDDVTPEMVLSYLDQRAKDRSNQAFNKDRKNLLAMWNWGRKIHKLASNPVAEIDKRSEDRKSQYVPPTEDILKVLAAAMRQEKVLLDSYLLTGARRSEIFRWSWIEDINFDQRIYRLGTRKTRDGSMKYEWLPMNDELYESLWWWWNNREDRNSPYVFPVYYCPDENNNNWKGEQRGNRWLRRLCKRAGVQPFGFHSLRRYVASILADTHKVSAKRIQRVLRHKNLATTERYIKHMNQDIKETLELLSKREIPEGDTRKQKGVDLDRD
jgi:integrase